MSAPPRDLDAARLRVEIERQLGDRAQTVWFAPQAGSTNDEARRAAASGAPSGSIFVADAQTAGRGRQGRAWHSPAGENLYLSILLRPRASPSELAPFALVIGLVVAEEIEASLAGARAGVKWPNDIWVDGRKIAGILVEASVAGGSVASLVVGVGVNVHTSVFPDDLSAVATSLAILGAPRRDRAALAGGIAARVVAAEQRFAADGFTSFLEAVRARDVLAGRRVRACGVSGAATGIDDGGRLLVRSDDGLVTPIVAGHVELLH